MLAKRTAHWEVKKTAHLLTKSKGSCDGGGWLLPDSHAELLRSRRIVLVVVAAYVTVVPASIARRPAAVPTFPPPSHTIGLGMHGVIDLFPCLSPVAAILSKPHAAWKTVLRATGAALRTSSSRIL